MLNSCILSCNLGADPEVFYSSEGDPVASFNLAFRSSKKKTGWIKITCFNRQAEVAERYLHKGARIAVSGYLDQQKWETDAKANGFAGREILLRFDCLIKTLKPKFETYYTVRSEVDEKRLIKKIQQVWDGISKGVFVPNDTNAH